ncbi:MAG TPA: hypothetical protein VL992_09965, partial [Tepidisphaeraceae bacterium]|nr:hypothetical protein [Tepidisphaeraceae bacterium]
GTQWDGSELAGRRILIHFEQGFGDAIQCIRYVPFIAERGGRVILAVPAEMKRLMQSVKYVEHLVTLSDPLPSYDIHCPIMSLPLAFKTTLQTIPAESPYLRSDPDLKRQWQSRLPNDNRLKIGLAWAGRRRPDPHRAVSPAELAPLADVTGVWFCSLQKPAVSPPPGVQLADFADELRDFADTAALMENLDLIITIDTSIAHLAGALGKPTWVLLKDVPDWRWLLGREDSPWYPTMRLFRQTRRGDWESPVRRVRQAIELYSTARSKSPAAGDSRPSPRPR